MITHNIICGEFKTQDTEMKEPTITFSNDYGDYDTPEKHRLTAKLDTVPTPQLNCTAQEVVLNEAAAKSVLETPNQTIDTLDQGFEEGDILFTSDMNKQADNRPITQHIPR